MQFLYSFSKWADNTNSMEFFSLFFLLMLITSYLFLLSEPGQRMTNQFERFGDEISKCDWYCLPVGLQKVYLIFLSDTQNSIEMTSYGNIICARDTAKKVSIICIVVYVFK